MPRDRHEMLDLPRAIEGPHAPAHVLVAGPSADEAETAVLLCHGRGGSAEDMLALRDELRVPGVLFVAPQAAGSTWYPLPFLSPLEDNEPHMSSALDLIDAVVTELDRRGIPPERLLILGFSQGGCLVLEYVAQNARRYGAVAGLSAALPGSEERQWEFSGSLEGTPVLLGCGDPDPHIPRGRLEASARALRDLGGDVDLRVYHDLGHSINRDEIEGVQDLLDGIAGPV